MAVTQRPARHTEVVGIVQLLKVAREALEKHFGREARDS